MSDINYQPNLSEERDSASEEGLQIFQDTMDAFLSNADVDAVYGEPFEKDGNVIIPAAEIVAGFGFGIGFGRGSSQDSGKPASSSGSSGGGGGGGGGGQIFSRPVAVIIASSEGVRIEPVIDLTKIALAGLTAGAFMLATLLRIRKYKDSGKIA